MKRLHEKVALVTGAARGMGEAIARGLAEEGAQVIVSDLESPLLHETAAAIAGQFGVRTLAVAADIAQPRNIASLVETAMDAFGRIDVLVNNAGILYPTRVMDVSRDEWLRVMDVNVNGLFYLTQDVLRHMIARRYGRIVNMSSSAGRSVSTLGGVHYTASKAAVLGITRAVAKEVAPHGITCNAVCPGLIDTDMVRKTVSADRLQAYEQSFPIARLGTPKEVADLVVFLSSDEAAYITGASIDINGGDLML
jgi:NAD(P)-dependent dehydrogenase (short-subunit alcohol dehydrogenase family)